MGFIVACVTASTALTTSKCCRKLALLLTQRAAFLADIKNCPPDALPLPSARLLDAFTTLQKASQSCKHPLENLSGKHCLQLEKYRQRRSFLNIGVEVHYEPEEHSCVLQAGAWILSSSAACLQLAFGVVAQAKLWPHLMPPSTAVKVRDLPDACCKRIRKALQLACHSHHVCIPDEIKAESWQLPQEQNAAEQW